MTAARDNRRKARATALADQLQAATTEAATLVGHLRQLRNCRSLRQFLGPPVCLDLQR